MEWRCEWCGKPHDEDDPPCDNCGHGSFERAVVRRPAAGEDPDTMTVWVCTECGREHPKHSPPCSRCNSASLERREKRVDESNLTERPGSASGGAVSAETTTVWVCPECGREHAKHSPPCSRCGNNTLDREQKRVDDAETTAPGYRDLVTPRYLAALGGVVLLAALFVLGTAGIVDLPGFPDNSVPDVDGVPGNATAVDGLSLPDVERAYVDALNDRRGEAGAAPLKRSGRLDEVATFYNQRSVKAEFGEGSRPGESELTALLEEECRQASLLSLSQSVDGRTQANAVGEALLESALRSDSRTLGDELETAGVDVHAARGELFVTQFVCT